MSLEKARGHDAGPGCVSEIHLKHLLALNLRKLGGAELSLAPRSYILQTGNCMEEEIEGFILDFKVSRALAIVQHFSGLTCMAEPCPTPTACPNRNSCTPEGLWGRELPDIEWEPGPVHASSSLEAVAAALVVVEQAIRLPVDRWHMHLAIADEEWALIRSYDTRSPASRSQDDIRHECRALLERCPIELQLPLLRHNVWALKPSCGQFGRGILLMDRLPARPAELLDWVACVGRGGQKGGKDLTQGCVLQKLIECPHLLDRQVLDFRENGSAQLQGTMPQAPTLKYNLRMIVLATLRLPCRIWLYRHGFVSVALRAYTQELNPLSHITNLRQGNGNDSQRRWPLDDLGRHLQMEKAGSLDEVIIPQVRRIVSCLFHALAMPPCSLLPLEETTEVTGNRSATGRKVRRFGFDFLIDDRLSAWLLEVNFLKNGYALGHAQAGPAGDPKRAFVDQFMADETLLRSAVASAPTEEGAKGVPSSFEELTPRPP